MIIVSPTTYSGLERFGLFGLFKTRHGIVHAPEDSRAIADGLVFDSDSRKAEAAVAHRSWMGAIRPEVQIKPSNQPAA